MIGEINVNTEVANTTAEEIQNFNQAIDNEFESVKNAMYLLCCNWSGAAAEQANTKFNSLQYEYVENQTTKRANVLKQYVRFIQEEVGEGYEKTEQANSSLADAFN